MSTTRAQRLSAFAKQCGQSHGFDAIGIASAQTDEAVAKRLKKFVNNDYHGSMDWMAETLKRRQSPTILWPEARSVIMVALNYGPESDPLRALDETSKGIVSVYARNRDYHDIINATCA